jgi:tight adherence protein C
MSDFLMAQEWARLAVLATIFVVVVILSFLSVASLASRSSIKRRVVGPGTDAANNSGFSSLRQQQAETAWFKLINLIERRGLSLVDTKDESLRRKLIAAGYSQPIAPRMFTLIRLTLTLLLPMLFIVVSYSGKNPPTLFTSYLIGAFLATMGLYIPNLFVRAKADRRQQELVNGFPDALDLMLVCVEAGLGLDAAFGRVGKEMNHSHPLLAELLGSTVLELRAGRSREDALRRMADRAGVEEIRSFSTLLIQSTKLGSSIGSTLRVYAAEMRERRRMRAEEKAYRLPVLISIPLVACMLPVMVGVLMLPAAIKVVRELLPNLM